MDGSRLNRVKIGLASLLGVALAASPLVVMPAMANTAGTGVVISEANVSGGSGNSTYQRFVELFNPTDSAINLDTYSLQYRASTGTASPTGVYALSGTIEANGHYLIAGTGASAPAVNLKPLPTPDKTTAFASGGAGGTLVLAKKTTALTLAELPVGKFVPNDAVADVIGWGTAPTFEGTVATGNSITLSYNRDDDGTDTDDNKADFTAADPTPQNKASDVETPDPDPTGTPTATPTPTDTPTAPPTSAPPVQLVTIPEIQGSTDTSPLSGLTVKTRGIVTASYPTGGFNGYVIQTPGTGGELTDSHTKSDGLYVFSSATVAQAKIGDYVEVEGGVSEYQGLTELTVAAGKLNVLTDTVPAVKPVTSEIPLDAADRESLESMLVDPAGDFTVTDNYDTNYYGSIVLNPGDTPLDNPTSVVEPGSADYTALVAENLARVITLDDGSSLNFNSTANKATELPYLSTTKPVRIGAAVTFTKPVIFDYRFSAWNFQPTQQLTTANADTVQPATFENTRTPKPEDVGGDVTLASFNVLNYFPTTGDTLTGCSFYTDREGNPITVNTGCDARGAANAVNLQRQQDKIVKAINALDADVVSLEEIENSAKFGKNRDFALSTLVAALNADAGAGTWSLVASPTALPASEDVIRTAFIYKSAKVKTVGTSVILDDPAFVNARQPLAQEFQLASGDTDSKFLAIVNHLKSKGSGSGVDADKGDGQGASNASRVNQAKALVTFADTLKTDRKTDKVFLTGDFNAYLKEDPIDVLTAAGYTDLGSTTGKQTYAFDGGIGSLDHIFASEGAADNVADVDIWNINSVESIALEYSRYNYNALNLYAPNAYRSSDHDPILVGLDFSPHVTDINLLNINDFHGRIDANTVKFAGTVEQLRAEGGEDNTLFLSDGDNIGASLFASSSQDDKPTIDVLNALLLKSSAVGNHEFDKGLADLTGRVTDDADWSYLGANVYKKGTKEPALQEYDIFTVDGVRVAVVGAVTKETPTLVSPGGISTVDFGDPVAAVNRVVGELKAADKADVFIAEYHEGAGAGTPDGATLEQELVDPSAFKDIVEKTTADVDAIFTGHTHKQYSWSAPVPGEAGETRPVLQTGSYGENIGQIVLKVDTDTDEVVSYTARNVPRVTTADATLTSTYPRVATVKTIVDKALADAAVIGNKPIGAITKDITTAYIGTTRDDRASESTLGNLVADSLVDSLKSDTFGGAEIGVVNPGGLRSDLLYAGSTVGEGDGVVTYAEANAVLPFVNNLGTTGLTGAQFKKVLEQQWQTNADGTIPTRPYLALGLSKNVTYTYDAARALNDRITSISINGKPIDPAKVYRVGTFSFLLEGGDNFREFTNGTGKRDSGLIDRDAWISYITANSPLSPAFDRRGVSVTDVPTASLAAGATATVKLSKLDLTSKGSPVNTEVSAKFEGSTAAATTSPVTAGAATVSFTVPNDFSGAVTLVITAKESGTVVRVPLTVDESTTTDINLLNINDFHGRIDANTVKFAGTIEQLRAQKGEASTLFLSDGDNIGASLFASSSQDDKPTIDVLNELDLKSSAVGNHEFDKGLADLTGRVTDDADWSYLGANVYKKGTSEPALQEYDIFTVNGVRVAVIGAVTEETPTLVSPGGVSTVDFGNPVTAVNRVVKELKDADKADVFVAEYHEGAGSGTPDGATLEQELALTDSAFAEIVTKTSADVDAIFTGHTHKQYSWDAPVPGEAGVTRPVLQTGSYGENIGQIVLTVDKSTADVTSYTARNVPRVTTADATLVSTYPRVAAVKTIVDKALADSAVIGNKQIGTVTADITTAYIGGTTRDDRGNESTLGNLVADSLVDSLKNPDLGGAEIGVVNPGGLRNELFYKGSSVGEGDGVVTYAEANAVLPFVNNLGTTGLTGAQFKHVLEQQWQTNADGTIPSRAYLALGLSKNVNYTYDASRAQDDRITSITIDGKPIDLTKVYRVGTFSFLLEGGDNFREFTKGTGKRDSGLIDRDAWISYITANSPLSPSFDRRGVSVTDVPTAPLAIGATGSVKVSKLDLTSLGSPANTEVSASFEGSTAAPTVSPVTAGAATVAFTVPADVSGTATLVVVAKESGTTVRIPVEVEGKLSQFMPSIEGTAVVGKTLTAYVPAWGPVPVALTFQWLRNGQPIEGATTKSYKLTIADVNASITFAVTGTKTGYTTATKVSNPVVVKGVLTATPTPKIVGTAKVGKKLTARAGVWEPAKVTLKYQWKRSGVKISGATKSTYTVNKRDKGKTVTVTITGSKTGYTSVAKTSKGLKIAK